MQSPKFSSRGMHSAKSNLKTRSQKYITTLIRCAVWTNPGVFPEHMLEVHAKRSPRGQSKPLKDWRKTEPSFLEIFLQWSSPRPFLWLFGWPEERCGFVPGHRSWMTTYDSGVIGGGETSSTCLITPFRSGPFQSTPRPAYHM